MSLLSSSACAPPFRVCLTGVFLKGVFLGMASCPAFAKSPINIEQLLAKPATWQLSSSIDYQAASSTLNQTQQSSWSTGIRYGVTPQVEVNARVSGWQLRQGSAGPEFRQSEQSISVGSNCLVKAESSWPAILVEARAVLGSTGSSSRSRLPSGQLALTSYKSLDPVVISFTAAMTVQRDYELDDVRLRPGMSWRIEPGINFAVNSSVTLFGSAAFSRRNAVYADDLIVANPSERIGMRGGIALALGRQHSIFVTGELANDRSGGMGVQWLYEF